MVTEIQMIKCPLCKEKWIQADQEITCHKCLPYAQATAYVADLIQSIENIKDCNKEGLRIFIPLMTSGLKDLKNLIQEVKNGT